MIKLCSFIIIVFARVLRYVGFIGVFSFLVIFPLSIVNPGSFEVPLGNLKGLAVDSEGNIYCVAQSYGRIQVYDNKGKFLYGIQINFRYGAFWIRINSDDQLEVTTSRSKKRYIFNKNGSLLNEISRFSNYLDGFDKKSESYCYDKKRDITYQIRPILLMPFLGSHVVKKDAFGKETIIIGTPFIKWLFMCPFPAYVFIGFSVVISFVFDKKYQEYTIKVINGELVPEKYKWHPKKRKTKG